MKPIAGDRLKNSLSAFALFGCLTVENLLRMWMAPSIGEEITKYYEEKFILDVS